MFLLEKFVLVEKSEFLTNGNIKIQKKFEALALIFKLKFMKKHLNYALNLVIILMELSKLYELIRLRSKKSILKIDKNSYLCIKAGIQPERAIFNRNTNEATDF